MTLFSTKCATYGMLAGCLVAVIAMLGCEVNNSASTDNSASALAITPSSVTVSSASSTNVVFTASGGTSPYVWGLSDSNGTFGVIATSGTIAVYTPTTAAGGVFLTVTDAAGASTTATIVQN